MPIRTVKYNPAFLSEEDLVRSFVVRHTDLELIVQVLRENVTDSNQHVLVTGPRGIGKTMLALRVAAEVRRTAELGERWHPVVFAEESYQVSTPGEFWLEALFHLAEQTNDSRWKRTYETLRDEHDEQRLRESALAQLMDFADAEGKRLLLVVENFGMLLGDQISDDDGWILRHALLHEPRIMLLATAASRFDEIQSQGKPMFELFRPHRLHPLTEDECRDVWVSITGTEPTDGRIRPIQILTGGNPRLVTIISSFAARLSFKELMTDLMHLVDEHTEYFKSHLDNLPPSERKVYLALADLWKPATARKVAAMVRLGVSKTSAFLRRLEDRGAVIVSDQAGRTKSYHVAERMYNIYYLMRRRAGASARVQALVNFMVGFYPPPELVDITARIAEEACELDPELRREHVYAYAAILKDPTVRPVREQILGATPRGFFEGADIPPSIRDLAKLKEWQQLEPELVELLEDIGALVGQPDRLADARRVCQKAIELAPDKTLPCVALALVHEFSGDYELAERACREAIELDTGFALARFCHGKLLHERLERYDEAEAAYRKAVELAPDMARGWCQLGELLHEHTERYEEAEGAYRRAVELDEQDAWAWGRLGQILHGPLERYEEAEAAYRRALELDEQNAWTWAQLGQILHEPLERYEEAEAAYRKAVELDEQDGWAWAQLGQLLHECLERYDEAEEAYRKAIEADPKYAMAWAKLGQLLHERLQRYEEAEEAYRKAIELRPEVPGGWAQLGELLHEHLERYEEAEAAYRKAVELDPSYARAWAQLGLLLEQHLKRYHEAEAACRKAIESEPEVPWGWTQLGQLLHRHLERYKEAEAAYRKAIELDADYGWAWGCLGQLLHEHLDQYEEAEAAYRKAIQLIPTHAYWPWTQLGDLLRDRLARYEEAEEAYRNAIALDEGCALAWLQLGRVLHEYVDHPDEAEEAYRKVLQLVPENALISVFLLNVLLDRPDRLAEALKLAEDALVQHDRDPILLGMLAGLFCDRGGASSLTLCEAWAREAVTKAPEWTSHQETLASVLCASGKGHEALEPARKVVEDASFVKDSVDDCVDLFVSLGASVYAQEALEILQDSPSAELLEPLIVGLGLFLGEKVNVAVEILEVGKDVVKRIQERQMKLSTERPTNRRSHSCSR